MSKTPLRFRQIHLDFHTSEAIEGIGAAFDPDEYAHTLQQAHVDSVTTFARCHHGLIYYDTKLFPERRHPHLKRYLLKEQIEACHKRDIRVPIYTTVQWDYYTSQRHPEWVALTSDGALKGTPPYEAGFYRFLCVNSPYTDFLKEHTREILETLPTDGLFFDIVQPIDCSCQYCLAGMKAAGLDPTDEKQRLGYAVKMLHAWKRDMTALVHGIRPEATVFYNAGHCGPRLRDVVGAYSHFELESLPSGGWGYLHFPLTARYARNLGVDCLGMTGKFHTSWGDFHSFKNQAALEYECFLMLALNSKCSVGDQLHPTGKLCPATYDLIGSVYEQVEAKEPYCRDARAVVDIGVLTPEEFDFGSATRQPEAAMGVTRLLQEGGHQFDMIDSQANFGKYRVLVLPDEIPVGPALAKKLSAFVAKGGALLASYKSGLTPAGDAFGLEELGVACKGEAPFSPDFIVPAGEMGANLPATEHVMYLRGLEVKAAKDAQTLCHVMRPYFNRTWEHFCSHAHTPSAAKKAYPGVVRRGASIYFAHPVFTQYNKSAPRWCKQLVLNALDMLLPQPAVRHNGPSTLVVTLNEQAAPQRRVLHLLHYLPERRGAFDVIEDVIPVYDVEVSVRADRKVKTVTCVDCGREAPFTQKDGRVSFIVGKVNGHTIYTLA